MTRPPNIIFIIADDHRYESIGIHGCTEVSTPTLDALARRGTVFDGHHCQGGMHPAVCVPSRATLMTGRNIFASSCNPTADDYTDGQGARLADGQAECLAFTIPEGMATFPERLREAGYRTHAIGKWHNDRAALTRSFTSADRIFFGGMSDHDRVPLHDLHPSGGYGCEYFEAGHSTDLFADSARRFLRAAKKDEPFCLYVSFTAPHDPRTPPASFEVDPRAVSLPRNFLPIHPFDTGDALVRDERLERFPRDPEAVRRHIADYYGMIAHLDAAVGSILEAADEVGLLEDSVVIYTSDHGLSLGQHGLMGKQNLYEHSLHVPLIMAGPGIPPGDRRACLTWHADTRATVLDLAGLSVESSSEGSSLLAVMRGQAAPPRTHFGAAYRTSQRMMRNERYKLIRYTNRARFLMQAKPGYPLPSDGSELEQLFDLRDDPLESVNLVFQEDLQPIRRELALALEEWQRKTGDPFARFV
jgi:arylsulfatase A-like enzyme